MACCVNGPVGGPVLKIGVRATQPSGHTQSTTGSQPYGCQGSTHDHHRPSQHLIAKHVPAIRQVRRRTHPQLLHDTSVNVSHTQRYKWLGAETLCRIYVMQQQCVAEPQHVLLEQGPSSHKYNHKKLDLAAACESLTCLAQSHKSAACWGRTPTRTHDSERTNTQQRMGMGVKNAGVGTAHAELAP